MRQSKTQWKLFVYLWYIGWPNIYLSYVAWPCYMLQSYCVTFIIEKLENPKMCLWTSCTNKDAVIRASSWNLILVLCNCHYSVAEQMLLLLPLSLLNRKERASTDFVQQSCATKMWDGYLVTFYSEPWNTERLRNDTIWLLINMAWKEHRFWY